MVSPKSIAEAPELGLAYRALSVPTEDTGNRGTRSHLCRAPGALLSLKGCKWLLTRDIRQTRARSVGPGCTTWANNLIRARSGFSAVSLMGDLAKVSWGITQPAWERTAKPAKISG